SPYLAILITPSAPTAIYSLSLHDALPIYRSAFVRHLRRVAQVDLRVISGKEEARLIYLGVASGANIGGKQTLFVDIGGGSTEVRSEEHTSELQSREKLVCRLLLEKKKEEE